MNLDVSKYTVVLKKFEKKENPVTKLAENVLVDYEQEVDAAAELHTILRMPGIYPTLTESVDAILLAKKIEEHVKICATVDSQVELNDKELKLIKKAIDVLLAKAAKNEMNFGGIYWEPLFLRLMEQEK